MLILLPPSEGKSTPVDGAPLRLDDLVLSAWLGEGRRRLLESLAALCRGPVQPAIEALGISPGQADEVRVNAGIEAAPAAPARHLYTGVLYDHLGFERLSPAARRRAERCVLIASGLWGLVRPGDRIPRYRFSMKPKLDGIGGLAGYWRKQLGQAMSGAGHDEEGGIVLDLRSGAYAAAWKPERARLIPVRVFRETPGGRRPVSHMAKAIRGDVARLVLEAPQAPADIESLAALVEGAGMKTESGPEGLAVTVSAA